MKEIVNLEKLNSYGYKLPANNPNYLTPDNITHCQLRYKDFSSSYVIQGSAVAGANSTFEFDVFRQNIIVAKKTYSRMKLYCSSDGVNYYENKSYGGTYGKSLFEEGVVSMIVGFANPTSANSYEMIVNTLYYNNEHVNITQHRSDTGIYYLQFDKNIIGTNQSNVIIEKGSICIDFGSMLGYCLNDITISTSSRMYFFTYGAVDIETPGDDVATAHLINFKVLVP